jgi:hypothetical protein
MTSQGQQEPIAAIAVHAFHANVMRGRRKSKYDQRVTIAKGDVVLLHQPEPGRAPFVLRLDPAVAKLAFHPGNFIMSAQAYEQYAVRKNQDDTILYQDRWFIVFTNLRVLQTSLIGILQAGNDGEQYMPMMERIVMTWVGKHAEEITDELEVQWSKYYKLRELWTRPGYPGEGAAAKRMGCKVLKRLVLEHIAPSSQPAGLEDFQ